MSSQGAAFLQERASSRRKAAAHTLSIASTGDSRIIALARMASTGHFDEVITSIDKMISLLKEEEEKELKKKEECEADRMENTRTAIKGSREMDENTETINRLNTEIGNHEAEIKDKEKEIKAHEEALAAAKKQRKEEAESYASDKKDDEA